MDFRDFYLFQLRVSGEGNHLHAVQQGRRYILSGIRRRDE